MGLVASPSERGCYGMTTFQVLTLMIIFASLVVAIINTKK